MMSTWRTPTLKETILQLRLFCHVRHEHNRPNNVCITFTSGFTTTATLVARATRPVSVTHQ